MTLSVIRGDRTPTVPLVNNTCTPQIGDQGDSPQGDTQEEVRQTEWPQGKSTERRVHQQLKKGDSMKYF